MTGIETLLAAINWQTPAALLCVALAAVWVIRNVVSLIKGSSGGCHGGGCAKCPSNQQSPSQSTIVSLDMKFPRKH